MLSLRYTTFSETILLHYLDPNWGYTTELLHLSYNKYLFSSVLVEASVLSWRRMRNRKRKSRRKRKRKKKGGDNSWQYVVTYFKMLTLIRDLVKKCRCAKTKQKSTFCLKAITSNAKWIKEGRVYVYDTLWKYILTIVIGGKGKSMDQLRGRLNIIG